MTATRRLAAILAVEVVGSSRLMGRDEAGRRVEENGYVTARIIQALTAVVGPGAGLESDPHNDAPPHITVGGSTCPGKARGTQARRRRHRT